MSPSVAQIQFMSVLRRVCMCACSHYNQHDALRKAAIHPRLHRHLLKQQPHHKKVFRVNSRKLDECSDLTSFIKNRDL